MKKYIQIIPDLIRVGLAYSILFILFTILLPFILIRIAYTFKLDFLLVDLLDDLANAIRLALGLE